MLLFLTGLPLRLSLFFFSIVMTIIFNISSRESPKLLISDFQLGYNLSLYSLILTATRLAEKYDKNGIIDGNGILILIGAFALFAIISIFHRVSEKNKLEAKKIKDAKLSQRNKRNHSSTVISDISDPLLKRRAVKHNQGAIFWGVIFPGILGLSYFYLSIYWALN